MSCIAVPLIRSSLTPARRLLVFAFVRPPPWRADACVRVCDRGRDETGVCGSRGASSVLRAVLSYVLVLRGGLRPLL